MVLSAALPVRYWEMQSLNNRFFQIDPALAIASGFGGSTASLATRTAAAAGLSGVGIETSLATGADFLFKIPANSLSPGPYDFGRMCK